jgi:ElaB/YqjD/DUF883 family membrane-anchored ribosome-binding protein
MTKSNKTTVDMVNDAIDKADLTAGAPAESVSISDEAAKLKSVAEKLTKDVEQYVSEGVEKFQVIAGEYSEKLNKAASTASDQAKKALEEGQSYVRANPTSTILGAFAIGVLLGALIRRN